MVRIVLLFPKWSLPWGCKFILPPKKATMTVVGLRGMQRSYHLVLPQPEGWSVFCLAHQLEAALLSDWLVCLVMWNTWGYNTVELETGYRRTPALWHTEVPSSFCQTGLRDGSSSASGQGFPGCLRWMVTSSLPGRYNTLYFHLPFFLFPCLGKGFSLFLVIWHWAVMVREKFMLLLSSSFRLV